MFVACSEYGCDGETVRTLVGLGADPKSRNRFNETIIHEVVKWPRIKLEPKPGKASESAKTHYLTTIPQLEAAIELGVDVNARDNHGNVALIAAIKDNYVSAVVKLLDAGATVTEKEKKLAKDLDRHVILGLLAKA